MIGDVGSMDIAAAAQLACLLEASAPKPGNVSRAAAFGDTSYEHFLASAAAIGTPLGRASTRPLGGTVLACIRETRRWVRTNTNLGMVLLFAPLARAAGRLAPTMAGVGRAELRETLGDVLANTTVADARDVYAAIRLASPGGLGVADEQDIADEPTVTLREAMQLAAERDDIAREYVSDFETTFETAAPTLDDALTAGLDWNDAVVETFLTVLAARPDTHIARRGGAALASSVSAQARAALAAGGVRTAGGRHAITELDAALRGGDGNLANPGTTADLTAAAIFVVLLGGGWHSRSGRGGSDIDG
ncbi:MAG TPA: triphosphoribosyl-dephospho-CoA synthase [Gemmatimonadaceae bacterium]|jgi:triphosphoribosyl-dephospho-CoA synthase|nr:triphosphoribosyl-dephospho-CoA synthase [Gemmatimonadaceae bacterium]